MKQASEDSVRPTHKVLRSVGFLNITQGGLLNISFAVVDVSRIFKAILTIPLVL